MELHTCTFEHRSKNNFLLSTDQDSDSREGNGTMCLYTSFLQEVESCFSLFSLILSDFCPILWIWEQVVDDLKNQHDKGLLNFSMNVFLGLESWVSVALLMLFVILSLYKFWNNFQITESTSMTGNKVKTMTYEGRNSEESLFCSMSGERWWGPDLKQY